MDGGKVESEKSLEERNREEGEWERKGGIEEKRGGKQKEKGETERERGCLLFLSFYRLFTADRAAAFYVLQMFSSKTSKDTATKLSCRHIWGVFLTAALCCVL